MKPTETEILLLREMVEESVARKMKAPADFQFLTGVIQERCKETLGVTTLKRIWGYIDGYNTTRYSTLSVLARFVGYRDWDDFLTNYDLTGESSNPVLGRALHPDRSLRRVSCASRGPRTAACCCDTSAKEASWWRRAKIPSSSPAIPFRVPASSSGSRSTSTISCTATTLPPSS